MLSASQVALIAGLFILFMPFSHSAVSAAPALGSGHHVWAPVGNGLNYYVTSISVDGSNVYVGGNFSNAGGVSYADNIALWNGSAWQALGEGLNNTVEAILRVGPWLYVAGTFTDAGGDPSADYLARWDGSYWSAVGNPKLDGANYVFAMATDGTNLYVGGQFTEIGGVAGTDHVAMWDGSTWSALDTGINTNVLSLAYWDSTLYEGGQLPGPFRKFVGGSWTAISGINNLVSRLFTDGADLYLGGQFLDAGGNLAADKIARYDGKSFYALGTGLSDPPTAMVQYNGELIFGGYFTDAGGDAAADYIARWDGIAWHNIGEGVTGSIYTLGWRGDDLYAGGFFVDAHADPLQDNLIVWVDAFTSYLPVLIKN